MGREIKGLIILVVLIAHAGLVDAMSARVLEVFDGDTLDAEIQGEKVQIKLYGIDAPESGQNGDDASKRFLLRLANASPVDVEVMSTDIFGRVIAVIVREGHKWSVNATIVANGYAWVKPSECTASFCSDLMKLESQAKRLRLGIWADFDLVPPWEFKGYRQK